MIRLLTFGASLCTLVLLGVRGAGAAPAGVCVSGGACYGTIDAAVAAAHDGDTIRLGNGTFAGGVTITKSVNLIGAGAQRTTIGGGGPVLTIGTYGAETEPTVSISGVTVTGGVTTTSPQSLAWVAEDGVFAFGGGIEIPPNAGFSGGANVTISNSVITGNRSTPTVTLGCNEPCAHFALGGGGGIDSWGSLTLVDSTVNGNLAGSAPGAPGIASEGSGGGILSHLGPLSLIRSAVRDNEAAATLPNGQFADGGGVSVQGGALTVESTSVSGNRASLQTSYSGDIDTNAESGGIHISGDDSCVDAASCVQATIRSSLVTGNTATASNSSGDAIAFCGGVCNDGILTLANSTLSGNDVEASSEAAGASGDSAGLGQGGPATVADTLIANNTVTSTGVSGTSTAQGGGLSTGDQDVATTITGTTVSGNRVAASSLSGAAVVFGAAMSNGGLLTVDASTFSQNVGQAKGTSGSAHGGGIWNSDFGGGPGSTMTLRGSAVTHNVLVGQRGVDVSGGGLYNTASVIFGGDTIRANVPDDCAGIAC